MIDFAKTDMLIWFARLAGQPFSRIQQALTLEVVSKPHLRPNGCVAGLR